MYRNQKNNNLIRLKNNKKDHDWKLWWKLGEKKAFKYHKQKLRLWKKIQLLTKSIEINISLKFNYKIMKTYKTIDSGKERLQKVGERLGESKLKIIIFFWPIPLLKGKMNANQK